MLIGPVSTAEKRSEFRESPGQTHANYIAQPVVTLLHVVRLDKREGLRSGWRSAARTLSEASRLGSCGG